MGPSAELQRCIVDCLECYSLCRQAAHGRLTEDCAEICRTTADFLVRGSPYADQVCAVCAAICEACARSLSEAEGMAECARACRDCAQSCRSAARRPG